MEVSGYFDAPASIPTGRERYVPSQQQVWWVWTFRRRKKFPIISGKRKPFSVSRG
jgi:hypothetical protein